MDLRPSNLGVDFGKQVVLMDFAEQKNSVQSSITRACREWITLCSSREGALSLLTQLTAGFLHKNPDYSAEWIESILPPVAQ